MVVAAHPVALLYQTNTETSHASTHVVEVKMPVKPLSVAALKHFTKTRKYQFYSR